MIVYTYVAECNFCSVSAVIHKYSDLRKQLFTNAIDYICIQLHVYILEFFLISRTFFFAVSQTISI